MKRYISLDAAVDAIAEWSCKSDFVAPMISKLERLPYIEKKDDIVCLVRCIDCKRWNRYKIQGEYPDNLLCRCEKFSAGVFDHYTKPDDYCCWGERMEGDNE